jgi:hypothetical protein
MVAPARILRGGQKPAGPILIGHRFEANGRVHESYTAMVAVPVFRCL